MSTNRELYKLFAGLRTRHAVEPTLERYLCALWSLVRDHAAKESLPVAEFCALLDRAFTAPAGEPAPDMIDVIPDGGGFAAWERCILGQIRDLRDMAANGQLADDQRHFGIDSPRGGRWYNFDPFGYLECATVGTFGGWDSDDEDSGRMLVPGAVGWDTFTQFLVCGQIYE